jgi:hypothetical protein
MSVVCGGSLFGPSSQYIKTNGGDFIATEGSNIRERLMLSDLRIPYKQILKSRIILKKGQTNYLLNHLGLGDNATFLSIKAVYDVKSKVEADNYVQYSYYDNLSKIYTFSHLLTLTGNSTNRVKQLYLTNPNSSYPVYLDVMVAIIDDTYEFFNDSVNQTATTFTGLEVSDIKSHVVGESIVFNDKSTPPRPLIYLNLVDINSIERDGKLLTIDDSTFSTLLFQFISATQASQAQSLLNYVIDNPNVDIENVPDDTSDPVLYFFSKVGGSSGTGSYIEFNGATSGVPYDTSYGYTFSTSIQLSTYGTSSISKSKLGTLLIDKILDNRDGTMSYVDSNLIITSSGSSISTITATGSYTLTFDFSDIALNYLDGVFVNIDII